MDKPNLPAAATDNLDAPAAAAPPADIETIENDTLVTATGGYWGGAFVYAPVWGPAFRPMYAAPAWGPYAWGPRGWWR